MRCWLHRRRPTSWACNAVVRLPKHGNSGKFYAIRRDGSLCSRISWHASDFDPETGVRRLVVKSPAPVHATAATGLDDEIRGNLHFSATVKHFVADPARGGALRGRISVFGSPTICSGLLLVHVGVWLPIVIMNADSTIADDFEATGAAESLAALARINFPSLDPTEIMAAATRGAAAHVRATSRRATTLSAKR